MNDFEDDIKKALKDQPVDPCDPEQENIVRELLVTSFKGRSKLLTVVAWLDMVVFLAIAVYSAVRFFGTTAVQTREQIMWAAIFIVSTLVVSLVKMWWWMMAHRTAVQRDIKRLEVRLTSLLEK